MRGWQRAADRAVVGKRGSVVAMGERGIMWWVEEGAATVEVAGGEAILFYGDGLLCPPRRLSSSSSAEPSFSMVSARARTYPRR